MGWAFVKRRMMAELGPDWQRKFASFEHHPAAAASLGQVHRARAPDGAELACKLQYPDMQSAVEADLQQLQLLFAIHRRMDPAIDTTEIAKEIGARVREELDYRREAKHVALYRAMLDGIDLDPRAASRGPSCRPAACSRSTGSKGGACSSTRTTPLDVRNRLATAMFTAWWFPFSRYRRDPRRSASRQLHGVRARRQAARHQSARLRLHPHLSAEIRRRRGRSLSTVCCTTTTISSCTPTRPGASRSSPAN